MCDVLKKTVVCLALCGAAAALAASSAPLSVNQTETFGGYLISVDNSGALYCGLFWAMINYTDQIVLHST